MDSDQSKLQLPQPEIVALKDGTQVTIRPIQPEDAVILKSGFLRLSQESIYYRFMSDKRHLSDEEAHHFASVDYTTRMAFIATVMEEGEEYLAGVARYEILLPTRSDTAEAAIVVSDSFQRRGLGRLLMKRLLDYAHEQGIRYLRAEILIDNHRIIKLIENGGLPYEKRYNEGTWEILVDIGGWQ
jgi:acetyltransferase